MPEMWNGNCFTASAEILTSRQICAAQTARTCSGRAERNRLGYFHYYGRTNGKVVIIVSGEANYDSEGS